MTKFHEGQEVEVLAHPELSISVKSRWCKAKIVGIAENCNLWPGPAIEVEFPDSSRAVSDEKHIRHLHDPDGAVAARSNILETDFPSQKFHEGQEVEVRLGAYSGPAGWRRATIVGPEWTNGQSRHMWIVEINDEHLLFDAEHVRLSKEQIEQELIANGERFLDTMS